MKRILSIALCAVISAGIAFAQEGYREVKGYVVDKNGNPIPGAEVMATGGGESVITDSDGSFKMNVHPLLKKMTASYSGMVTKKLNTNFNSDMIFRLKPEKLNPWFLNVNAGVVFGKYWSWPDYRETHINGSIGIMTGRLGKWGFYGKAVSEVDMAEKASLTFGAIKSINKQSTFLYAGLGYGYFMGSGMSADLGFIFRTSRHFNISIGYNLVKCFEKFEYCEDYYYDYENGIDRSIWKMYSPMSHAIEIGFGYVF